MDDRLEQRLREEPTSDPRHEPGLVFDRLAGSATTRVRPVRVARANLSFGFALAGIVVIIAFLSLGPARSGSGGPSPSSPTLPPALDAGRLQAILDAWATRHGDPGLTVTAIDAHGLQVTLHHAAPGRSAPGIVRIGEVSRVVVVSTVMAVIECAKAAATFCTFPVPTGAFGLDDPISRWLPDAPAGPTVRQLLDGTSGLAPVAASAEELAVRIAANAAADWSREGVMKATFAAPQRFTAGARREPVDTEFLLLEELIEIASGRSSSQWLDSATVGHIGLGNTLLVAAGSARIGTGQTAAGEAMTDLPAALLAIVGNAGGMASDSTDLARLASAAWGSAILREPSSIDLVTDADDGHLAPWGGLAYCPCTGRERTVIAQTGHAIAWSAVSAYDFGHSAALGIVLDADVDQAALEELVADLMAADGS